MAAKSDFAQKLLHDLRLRKERMSAVQNSSSSRPASRGAQGNPGIAQRGSKKVTAPESVGSRSGNSMRKTGSSRSSFHMEDSSNQIVLYGRGGNSERMGDLPTTLSIGFENGGKFTKIDASGSNQLLNFLHHISRRSVATGKMEITGNMGKIKNTSYSQIHIHDVSKGVQKLNQILRTCSNGGNFDTYSIEVGKELLRGAMDLEESLRMLVNLQDASDYMIKSQRKSKIKLLDEDEDDQTEVVKASDLKVVARPRFSFDKPKNQSSNKLQGQLVALTYPEEKQARNSSSHSRAGSCVSDLKPLSTHLEPKDHKKSHSKPEKGRISNVIAKLMGLEEFSPKQESEATPLRELSANKTERMAANRSSVNVEPRHQDQRNSKTVTSATRTPMLDSRKTLKAENFSATSDGSSRVTISDGQWQNIEVAAKKYAGTGNQLNNSSQKDQMREYKGPQEKEKQGGTKDDKEKKSKLKIENGEMLVEDARQPSETYRHVLSKSEIVSEDSIELKRAAIQTRNKNVQSPQTSKQHLDQEEHKVLLREVPKKSDLLEQKRKQQLQKKKKQVNESHYNQSKTTMTSKPNKSTKCLPKKKPCDAIAPSAVDKKKPVKQIGAKLAKDLSKNRLLKVKETSVNLTQQVKNKISAQAFEDHTCQEDAASNARSEITKAIKGTSENESPVQTDMKMQEKNLSSCNGVEHTASFEDAKAGITSLDREEKKTESPNAEDLLHGIAEVVSFSNLGGEEESKMLDVSKTQPCNEESKDMVTAIPEPQEKQLLDQETTVPHDDIQLRSHEVLHQHRKKLNNGIHEESQELSKPELKKTQSNGATELLTESEKHLKEKLIKGQLFLNTAEALFKLNIPVSILDGNDHHNQDSETKLILDCGHELLKKKGQKQETSLFPGKDNPIANTKIRSFDGLIKQISRDFDTLKSYGGNAESDTAECLNTMLEKDFEKTHSEVCCVWDFGWSEDPFGFHEHYEIAKDVEKRVLNGLLDDITKELLQIVIASSA